MALKIEVLVQAWLKAETVADRARKSASRATERLVYTREKAAAGGGKDIVVLLNTVETTVETLKARHEAAERQAAELFERMLEAKSQGEVHA